MSLLSLILGRRLQTRPADVFGFLSPSELHRILARERMRSDRSQREFAFVTFALAGKRLSPADVARFGGLLTSRLRITDDIGFLNRDTIGVVLPETPLNGAAFVAQEITKSFTKTFDKPLDYEIHVYPHDRHPHDDQPAEQNGNSVFPRVNLEHSAQPLETMFMQRMPIWKRGIDIVGATVGLVLAAPLVLISAALIKLTSKGPVFFAQSRAGLGGQPFTMFKLRTMHVGAEEQQVALLAINEQDGPAFKLEDDPRVTAVGRFLRRTSIDELPQLWNVLRGEMSLVGPRPLPCHEAAGCAAWQRRRLDVTPGLTCTWQVAGRSQVSFAEWVRMDLQYIRARSLKTDLKLMAHTIPAVLLRKGAK